MEAFTFHDVDQNGDEWLPLRGGRLTASSMGKVMANYGKAFGEPARKLAVQIAVEQITGEHQSSNYSNEHMERGHEQEPLARMLYEEEMFCTVDNGGFFGSDFLGCSPDNLVGSDGVIEIKSVIASVHFANIRRANVDPAYKWQCFANVKFTARAWLDFVSYCADFPVGKRLYVYRLYAKDLTEQFNQLDTRIAEFKQLVDTTREQILTSEYTILEQAA